MAEAARLRRRGEAPLAWQRETRPAELWRQAHYDALNGFRMSQRPVPTWLIVALALTTGIGLGAGGLWLGLTINESLQRRAHFERRLQYSRLDSAHAAEARRRDSMLAGADTAPFDPRPIEMSRRQVHHLCAVTLLLQDDRAGGMRLLHVNGRHLDGHAVGRAYAYSDAGFPKGSIVTVLFSQTQCGTLRIAGWGATLLDSAPPLLVR